MNVDSDTVAAGATIAAAIITGLLNIPWAGRKARAFKRLERLVAIRKDTPEGSQIRTRIDLELDLMSTELDPTNPQIDTRLLAGAIIVTILGIMTLVAAGHHKAFAALGAGFAIVGAVAAFMQLIGRFFETRSYRDLIDARSPDELRE